MRSLLLTLICFVGIGATTYAPFLGVLMWHWLSIMNPHVYAYGFVAGLPVIAISGAVTLLMWLVSAEPKRLPVTAPTVLLIVFTVWVSLTTIFAASPEPAVEKWIQVMKILLMVFVTTMAMTTRMRIIAMVWVAALSLGFWGVKGGIWALLTGGANQVLGPAGSFMADNNQFALALLMGLPLWLFLGEVVTARFVKPMVLMGSALMGIATLFTYSRGAAVGLAVVSLFIWWSSRRRVATAVVFVLAIGVGSQFVPEKWFNRIDTIKEYDDEQAPESRLLLWQQAYNMGNSSPIIGYGFKSFFNYDVFLQHRADSRLNKTFEAHSIYFQMLGEHGYVGLIIFLALGASYLWSVHRVYRRTKGVPELFWAHRLGRALMLSGIAFAVSGTFLSQAYFDFYYLLIALAICLDRIVREGDAPPKPDNFPQLLAATRINYEAYGFGPMPNRLDPAVPALARN